MSQIDPSTMSSPASAATSHHDPEASGDPFRVFGIVGFVLSLLAVLNIAGLIISIIALVRSRRAGFRNGFALAGTVIGSIGVAVTMMLGGIAATTLVDAAQTCARLGAGVHVIGSSTYTCTPTSFHVTLGAQPPASSTSDLPSTDDEEWAQANERYSDATCPTNKAREALYAAISTEEIEQLRPVAASASEAFTEASAVFLDHTWPAAIEEDIRFLGETSSQLADGWATVAEAADIGSANAVLFPDAQTPFEAAQRIRATLSEDGQQPLEC